MDFSVHKNEQKKLLAWFEKNKRSLPWRQSADPYKIWISEILLQQTTSKTVIPYYQKFLKKFPHLSSLAKANEAELLSLWAGLGYYKRARNLMKAGKQLHKQKAFPKTYRELLKLPGFGPYTARAVSSLAFEEPVGVLDGNVIRFLSRFYAFPFKWWKARDRKKLQRLSDLWVKSQKASLMNQALMEIGALICKSKNPSCLLCPLIKNCQAHKKSLQARLPLKKMKKSAEFWHYQPETARKDSKWAFVKNKKMPFLKEQLVFPGQAKKLKNKAKHYDFVHSIMHYKIFVTVKNYEGSYRKNIWQWLGRSQIKRFNPSSLIQKILNFKEPSRKSDKKKGYSGSL